MNENSIQLHDYPNVSTDYKQSVPYTDELPSGKTRIISSGNVSFVWTIQQQMDRLQNSHNAEKGSGTHKGGCTTSSNVNIKKVPALSLQ